MESRNYTRFEKSRLIGSRALQIAMGAEPMVDFTPDQDPIRIAINEYDEGVLPLDALANKEQWKDL
jgi:DNA-directed RNA polymerase subunit K/omega